jgi:hypothetical protein
VGFRLSIFKYTSLQCSQMMVKIRLPSFDLI